MPHPQHLIAPASIERLHQASCFDPDLRIIASPSRNHMAGSFIHLGKAFFDACKAHEFFTEKPGTLFFLPYCAFGGRDSCRGAFTRFVSKMTIKTHSRPLGRSRSQRRRQSEPGRCRLGFAGPSLCCKRLLRFRKNEIRSGRHPQQRLPGILGNSYLHIGDRHKHSSSVISCGRPQSRKSTLDKFCSS